MSASGTAGPTPEGGGGARWPVGPEQPSLPTAVVDVWRVDLAEVDEELASTLSAPERERAARIAGERERRVWRRARGVLRELLGRYMSCEGAAVALAVDDQGKPSLTGATSIAPLCFNLSHSGELALYAFSASGHVGIDVEMLREDRSRQPVDHVALARRAFGEHEAQRLSMVEPAQREWEFLRAWARHEAELKWRGSGIGGAGEHGQALDAVAPWTVELDLDNARAAAAVALSDRATELRQWSFARGSSR
ncbi:MAG TPA: 4'-phosphopantetheinyl transferase superfamily protein [Solirubrobacteraceae bacterium]|jgi:4'-phosphopantetheinyl transferase|nr:4'-phosphopantetheinyl transferase superfamily protein [Solirubrobacteraceae bacterium]